MRTFFITIIDPSMNGHSITVKVEAWNLPNALKNVRCTTPKFRLSKEVTCISTLSHTKRR